VRFLKHLLRPIPGKLLVIWDGSPIHRGGVVKDFLAGGACRRLKLEQLPGYAPDFSGLQSDRAGVLQDQGAPAQNRGAHPPITDRGDGPCAGGCVGPGCPRVLRALRLLFYGSTAITGALEGNFEPPRFCMARLALMGTPRSDRSPSKASILRWTTASSGLEDVLKRHKLVILVRGAARGSIAPILCDEEPIGERGS
jgi:hypothetical protein